MEKKTVIERALQKPPRPVVKILKTLLEFPQYVAGVLAERWWDAEGRKRLIVVLYTEDGAIVDWEAVLGEVIKPFRQQIERWMRDERKEVRLYARFWRKGKGAGVVYTSIPRSSQKHAVYRWTYGEDSPTPPRPNIWAITRPLEERVNYALSRYEGFWRHIAPRGFREKYPEKPNLEGLLAMNEMEVFWHSAEDEAAIAILKRRLSEMEEGK